MNIFLTLGLLAGTAAGGVACGWLGSRPADPLRGPRMAPYRFLMIASVATAIMLIVHLLNLIGGRD